MTNGRKQVNVRLDYATYDELVKLGKDTRMSMSDMVRLSIEGSLEEVSARKISKLDPQQQREVILKVGEIFSGISQLNIDNKKLGNNVNQLVKKTYTGDVDIASDDLRSVKKEVESFQRELEELSKGVSELWRILV